MTKLLLLSVLYLLLTTGDADASPKHDLVRKSCVHASYPDVCLRTLSSYGGAASTPRDLAQAAVRVSLSHVRRASEFLAALKGSGRREQGALNDCVEQMADTVDELSKTMAALQHLRRGADFRWQMSIQTEPPKSWNDASIQTEPQLRVDFGLRGLDFAVGARSSGRRPDSLRWQFFLKRVRQKPTKIRP